MKIRILVFELLYLLAMLVVVAGAAFIQNLFPKDLGEYIGFLFSGHLYGYNIIFYIIGYMLFLLSIMFAYRFILKDEMTNIKEYHIIVKICYFILAGAGSFLSSIVYAFVHLFNLGWLNDIRPELLLYLGLFGWPVILLIFMLTIFISNYNKAQLGK